MEYKEIQNLIKLIDSTDLTEFKLKEGDFELMIRTKDYFKLTKNLKSQVIQTPVVQAAPAPITPLAAESSPTTPAAPAEPSADAAAEEAPKSNFLEIKSPIVGTFYRSPSPDKEAYVKIGDRVESGDIVCIVEAMKLFNEIESEISGKIVEILVEDSTPVEYDQPLFRVEQ